MRNAIRRQLFVICLIVAVAPAARPLAAEQTTAEQEIRAAADSFVESFKQRDAQAIAAHWTEDGIYVNEEGERFEGRESIQSEYAMLFQVNPDDLDLKLEIDSIRLVNPQTAIEEGRAALVPQPPGESRVMSRYTAVHVKQQDGRWLMSDVRDTLVELPPDLGQLEDLEWLVGTWAADSKEAQVEWKIRWIENRQFLAHSYSVTENGKVNSTGLQIIGVDPSTDQITSWNFSSEGGHAVGYWVPHEKGWMVESNGVLKDGTETSATYIFWSQDENTLVWKSVDRTVDETSLPDTPEVTLKRK